MTDDKHREQLERALARDLERTAARIAALRRNFEDIVRSGEGSPPDDEHDPDGATSGFERAQISALLETAESDLAELEVAQTRLREGTYGSCEKCGRPIAFERLLARPSVRTCVRCASVT